MYVFFVFRVNFVEGPSEYCFSWSLFVLQQRNKAEKVHAHSPTFFWEGGGGGSLVVVTMST